MQVVLVYLKPFRCNLLLKCVAARKITKAAIWGFKVVQER